MILFFSKISRSALQKVTYRKYFDTDTANNYKLMGVRNVVTTIEREVVLKEVKQILNKYILLHNSKAGYLLFGIFSLTRKDLPQNLCF